MKELRRNDLAKRTEAWRKNGEHERSSSKPLAAGLPRHSSVLPIDPHKQQQQSPQTQPPTTPSNKPTRGGIQVTTKTSKQSFRLIYKTTVGTYLHYTSKQAGRHTLTKKLCWPQATTANEEQQPNRPTDSLLLVVNQAQHAPERERGQHKLVGLVSQKAT